MSIVSIINELRANSGKKVKEKIIHENSDNVLFKTILSMTYDPRIKFGIKVIPNFSHLTEDLSLSDAINALTKISDREVTGDSAKEYLASILSNVSEQDSDVIKLIIGQSLEIGCGASTINKAIGKNFIKDTPYMGCSSFSEKKANKLFTGKKVILSQLKVDGRYSNKRIIDGTVACESRQGLETDFGNVFDDLTIFQNLYGEPLVLNGELIIKGLSRYESNGVISSLASIGEKIKEGEDVTKEKEKLYKKHGDTYENYLSQMSYIVWDFIPNDIYNNQDKWVGGMTYAKRFEKLSEMIESAQLDNIELVSSRVIRTPSEVKSHYLEMVGRGEEGTVIKSDEEWVNSKPTHNLKVKLEMSVDLKITGYNLGTGKNEGLISSLNVETECGKLKTSPAGINEKTMEELTEKGDQLIGQIIEMKSNGISQDKEGNYSMLHPVFLKIRDDKDYPNSLEECKEIELMAKEVEDFSMITSESLENNSYNLGR